MSVAVFIKRVRDIQRDVTLYHCLSDSLQWDNDISVDIIRGIIDDHPSRDANWLM